MPTSSLEKFASLPEARPQAKRQLLAHLRPYQGWIWVAGLLGVATAAGGAVEPLFFRYLVDLMMRGHADAALRGHLLGDAAKAVALLAAISIVQQVLQTGLSQVVNKVRFDASSGLSRQVLHHIFQQPLSFHLGSDNNEQSSGVGYVMTRLDRGVAAMGQLIGDLLQSLVPNIANLLMMGYLLFQLSPRLALCALAPLPLFLWTTSAATRVLVAGEEEVQEGWSTIYRRVYEVLGVIKTVKSMAREDAEIERYDQGARSLFHKLWRLVWVDSGFQGLKGLLALAGRASVLLYGVALVLQGRITPGTWVAAITYASMIYPPMTLLTSMYTSVRKSLVAVGCAFEFLDRPTEQQLLPASVDRAEAIAPRWAGQVRFERVSFAYPAQEGRPRRRVLRDVSFEAQPGEVIALVGGSGEGKTTLMDLLLRFYHPEVGAISIDGVGIQEMRLEHLRSQIAVVLQEPVLLDGTIGENIAYARPGASEEQIELAARAAYAHEFIEKMPLGYETRVGERGARLSGGQKQRLAIARALLCDPSILILDEATSQLDAESEQAVNSALQNLVRGRTTFLISHRLASTLRANRVLVLAGGAIAEMGTPDELAHRQGRYARLLEAQQLKTTRAQAATAN